MLILSLVLTGCGTDKSVPQNNPDKLSITLVGDNSIVVALEEKFPDITFEVEHYKGANASGYIQQHLQHPDAMPDLFIGTYFPEQELQKKSLLDLSGYEIANRYQTGFINNCSVDGHIYLLPVCYQMQFYVYNKTLFKEHGWEKPANHQELVSLVKQIRRESPELIPISLPGSLPGYSFQYFSYFSQCDFLNTPEGVKWQESFQSGKASAKEGFGEGGKLAQELIDAGAYDESLTENANTDSLLQLVNRDAAMAYVSGGYEVLNKAMKNGSDEYGAFPFMGKTDDSKAVGVSVGRYLGLSKQLGEKGNEEKLENAMKIMDYLSTPEGLALVGGSIDNVLYPLKSIENQDMIPIYRDVYEDVKSGYIGNLLYTGYTDILIESGVALGDAFAGKSDIDEALNVFDRQKSKSVAQGGSICIGEVAERMSNAEAAQFAADMYLDTGLGQISLVSDGTTSYSGNIINKAGVCGTMFEGKITDTSVYINIPYQRKFVTLMLTGQQIKTMLEEGLSITNGQDETEVFNYHWSGMNVNMKDGKVISMKISDKNMAMDKVYSVVMNEGSYSDEIAAAAEIQIHGDFPDTTSFFKEWLSKDGNYVIQKPEVNRK